MEGIVDYCVATGGGPQELEEIVKGLLKQGWSLQGGVSVERSPDFVTYAQALTKN